MSTAAVKISVFSVDEWDLKIRQGQGEEAREGLRNLNLAKVPRAEAAKLAWVAWRAGLPDVAARLLHPIVRADTPLQKPATPEEVSEYAVALVRLGAVSEALALLEGVDPKACPKALLYKGFALATQWDSPAVEPLLRKYLEVAKDPYDRLVAETNLAMSLVHARKHREAAPLLRTLLHETSVRRYRLLLGVTLDCRAADLIQQNKLDEAEAYLKHSSENLAKSGGLDEFFSRKWSAVLSLKREVNRQTVQELERIQEEANRREHWETVRDCDRHLALAKHDKKLLLHVYFGTPLTLFRERLLSDFGEKIEVPTKYSWHLGGEGEEAELDLCDSEKTRDSGLKPAQLTWRLLVALSSDFYRAFRSASLHETAFPGEHYNAFTSAQRVRVAIERARKWIAKRGIPVIIEESRGFYKLSAKSPVQIHLASTPPVDAYQLLLTTLKRLRPKEAFSSTEAEALVALSARSLSRLLARACEDGVLKKTGKGKNTRYQF